MERGRESERARERERESSSAEHFAQEPGRMPTRRAPNRTGFESYKVLSVWEVSGLALRPGRLGSTSIRSPGECRSGGSGEFRFEHKNKIVNSYLSGCLCFALRPDRFGSLSTGRQDECQSGELQFEQHLQVIKLHLPGRPPIRTPARSAQKHFVHEIGRVPTQRAPDRTEPASYKVLPVRGGCLIRTSAGRFESTSIRGSGECRSGEF